MEKRRNWTVYETVCLLKIMINVNANHEMDNYITSQKYRAIVENLEKQYYIVKTSKQIQSKYLRLKNDFMQMTKTKITNATVPIVELMSKLTKIPIPDNVQTFESRPKQKRRTHQFGVGSSGSTTFNVVSEKMPNWTKAETLCMVNYLLNDPYMSELYDTKSSKDKMFEGIKIFFDLNGYHRTARQLCNHFNVLKKNYIAKQQNNNEHQMDNDIFNRLNDLFNKWPDYFDDVKLVLNGIDTDYDYIIYT